MPLALAALAAGAGLSAAGGAEGASGCIAPDVVGVDLAHARHALEASGCQVAVSQLPPHGSYVTPASPDGRQLIRRQSPAPGARTGTVTVFAAPLCSQPAQPGPPQRGVRSGRGPTELIAALYLRGGPVRTSPHCRRGTPAAGTLVVSTPDGTTLVRRQVRAGRFAIFPLAPGSYVISGTVAGGGAANAPVQAAPVTVRIAARHTTRTNVVADVR